MADRTEDLPPTVHRFVRPFLVVVAALLTCGSTTAQIYDPWHRPVDVSYRAFRTPHFRMIYQSGLGSEAAEMGDLLEDALPEVRALVGLRRELDVPVVLNRFSDSGNGFVTSLPFRQEIEVVPLRGKILSPRFHSWFETVAPHELVHAAHAESGHGFGIGWMLRRLGPDLARSLNLSGPRGISEGAAVWFESRLHGGSGRLNHSLFEMEFRAAMLSDDPWSIAQMLEPPSYTLPYDRYYHGGGHVFEYMNEAHGDVSFFRRARSFYYRFPLLGYGPALWYGAGVMPHVLGRRVRKHFRQEAAEFVDDLGPASQHEVVASERGTVHRRPTWIDDENLLVYARGYHLRPGFYTVDARTGRKDAIAYASITVDYMYTLDRDSSGVLYSRFVFDPHEPIRATAEVFRLDLSSGRSTRITHGGRAFAPVPSPDGQIWAARTVAQFNEWAEVNRDGAVTGIRTFDRTTLVSIVPSPDGHLTVALLNREGRQGVFEVGVEGTLEPLVVFRDASVYDISWSSDGRYLLFSADPRGVANIFAWELATDRVYKLTNVPFGAIEPSLSPDGSTLAFVNYRHERYELARMPFTPGEADVVPASAFVRAVPAGSSWISSVGASEDDNAPSRGSTYRPFLEIRPRVFYPYLLYQRPTGDDEDVHLGFGAGAGLEWSDPLQYWTGHTSAFYQAGSVWGRVRLQSGRFLLRPSAEAFREPSTVVVRLVGEGEVDTVRVGRDERGISFGLRLPAVFEANVFQTTALASVVSEYRRERLFNDDGDWITAPGDRLTLRPSLQVGYRIQANTRDIVPNSGLRVTAFSMVDLWSERERISRYVRVRGDLYLPFLRSTSTGIALQGSLHAQNRGGILDLTSFFPRGYETETVFLDDGAYGKLGFEITQPLWYIDDGFILLPLFFRALFAYGFLETMQPLSRAGVRRTVAGGGLGLQARVAHGINLTLKVAPVYRLHERDWSFTFR